MVEGGADTSHDTPEASAEETSRRGRTFAGLPKRAAKRLGKEILAGLVILLAVVALAIFALDTGPGHRFLADRIAEYETKEGYRVEIGRIEGSIYDEAVLSNVRVRDRDGVFIEITRAELDWAPFAWLYNDLHIDRLDIERFTLIRKPNPRDYEKDPDAPILPNFDIFIGDLAVQQLVIGEAVTGTERTGRLAGRVDIRSGRALAVLRGALDGGDEIALALDANPDEDRLDLSAQIDAPGDGLIPMLLGIDEGIDFEIEGEGSWAEWRGRAAGTVGANGALDLDIVAADGVYSVEGNVDPDGFVEGLWANLTAGGVAVQASFTFDKQVIDGDAMLTSRAARIILDGGVDLNASRFDAVDIGVDLRQPEAFLNGLAGERLRLVGAVDGAFSSFDYDYRFTSDALIVNNVTLFDLYADGSGRWSRAPQRVPLNARASRVVGLGVQFEEILRDLDLTTMLVVSAQGIRSENLRFTSNKFAGGGVLLIDYATDTITFALDGVLNNYLIPGLGIVDVETKLDFRPGSGGLVFDGTAVARVRRLDNSFFAGLLGGLPTVTSNLSRGTDGIIRFTNVRLTSPLLNLTGQGFRRRDGTVRLEGSGRHATYGPVNVTVDGRISRPTVDLRLASPQPTLGLSDVSVRLDPTARGFAYDAAGGSRFGPFTSSGVIVLPRGGQAAIEVADLSVAGSSGSGRLAIVPGGFDGQLVMAGGELNGTLDFSVPPNTPRGVRAQRIAMDLSLDNASFPGPPAIRAGSGTVDAVLVLSDTGFSADGEFALRDAVVGGFPMRRVTGSGRVVNGVGTVRANLVGAGRSDLTFALEGDVSPTEIRITGAGELDGRPLRLSRPAIFALGDDGWQLSDVDLTYGQGRLRVSNLTSRTQPISVTAARLPLRLFDLVSPDLGLSGSASGRLNYNPRSRQGSAELQVRGLSRSGLLVASQPIDLAMNAKIDGNIAGARVVMESDGQNIGRGQIRFAPLSADSNIADALLTAPIFAQLRYSGPAATLWRLTGVELFDLSGPLRVGLDARGTILRPRITGSLAMNGGRLESVVTGTRIDNLVLDGRFRGARLFLDRFAGTTGETGRIEGLGDFTFLPGGIGVALDLRTDNARMLARDDLAATISGPLRIRSSGRGGTISGNVRLDQGTYTLGRAGRVAEVPSIEVIERNLDPEEVIEIERIAPWQLDLGVTGGPLFVKGLGLDSSWTADLQIGGSVTDPLAVGTLQLDRGEYNFAGRRFRVERGEIDFVGSQPINPELDIVAEAEGSGIQAQVRVSGRALEPQIEFISSTIADQDEVLSQLLFGTSVANLSAAELIQLGSAVASLQGSGGGGLDPINAVRSAIGLDRLRILPADVSTGQETAIGAGKYITRRLFVEVITDGRGYTATQVEFQITRWLSLLASISSIGRTSANVRFQKDY